MIQSGHGMRDGRTDGRTDGVKPVYPPNNFVVRGYNQAPVLNISDFIIAEMMHTVSSTEQGAVSI